MPIRRPQCPLAFAAKHDRQGVAACLRPRGRRPWRRPPLQGSPGPSHSNSPSKIGWIRPTTRPVLRLLLCAALFRGGLNRESTEINAAGGASSAADRAPFEERPTRLRLRKNPGNRGASWGASREIGCFVGPTRLPSAIRSHRIGGGRTCCKDRSSSDLLPPAAEAGDRQKISLSLPDSCFNTDPAGQTSASNTWCRRLGPEERIGILAGRTTAVRRTGLAPSRPRGGGFRRSFGLSPVQPEQGPIRIAAPDLSRPMSANSAEGPAADGVIGWIANVSERSDDLQRHEGR